MVIEQMTEAAKDDEQHIIPQLPDFKEFYTEVSVVTGFTTPAGSFINISFCTPSVVNYRNVEEQNSSAKVVLKKVAAATMTISRAEAFHESLGRAIKKHKAASGE